MLAPHNNKFSYITLSRSDSLNFSSVRLLKILLDLQNKATVNKIGISSIIHATSFGLIVMPLRFGEYEAVMSPTCSPK